MINEYIHSVIFLTLQYKTHHNTDTKKHLTVIFRHSYFMLRQVNCKQLLSKSMLQGIVKSLPRQTNEQNKQISKRKIPSGGDNHVV